MINCFLFLEQLPSRFGFPLHVVDGYETHESESRRLGKAFLSLPQPQVDLKLATPNSPGESTAITKTEGRQSFQIHHTLRLQNKSGELLDF